MIDAGPEEQLRSDNVTGGQVRGVGNEDFVHLAHIGPVTRLYSGSLGVAGLKWANGPPTQSPLAILKGVASGGVGPAFGPSEG